LIPYALPSKVLAISLIVLAALLHGARVRTGVGMQNALVFLKFVLIIILLRQRFSQQKHSVPGLPFLFHRNFH
jgi:hypothetical protein